MAKERVIQFGEGGFLRGFADYFFYKLNEKGLFDGKVVIVQPRDKNVCDKLMAQNCEYNLYLRGIKDGEVVNERTHIDVISRCLNPYREYDEYLKLAENPDFRFIVSNTTEAGIEYLGTENLDDRPAKSYPAKLTQLLYHRFKLGLKGFIILPCELIDNNADTLKECICKYADLWGLGDDFIYWLNDENDFCNTLVDRIVTGFPKDEAEDLWKEIGYRDEFLDAGEIFHLWVIEGDYEDELPFKKAGLNVVWADDVKPYKKRKVRILNGGHTSMVLGAYLYGLETVGECLNDEIVSSFLKKCIFDEIIPTLGAAKEDIEFGNAVLERFSNPFIRHMLLSIALNSVSKFQVRVLPTILEYKEKFGVYPMALTFSLSALIAFYRTDKANDSEEIVNFMKSASVADILNRKDYWQADLTEMLPLVEGFYSLIEKKGMKAAYKSVLDVIKINKLDNVAVALKNLESDIPMGHKIALCNIASGEKIIKYGFPIGIATSDIKAGEHVHVHNIKTLLSGNLEYTYNPCANPSREEYAVDDKAKCFDGYVRTDGRVGIRNDLWIIPTVGCVNANAKAIAEATADLVGDNINSVVAFSHPYGCSQMGDDQENFRRAIASLINHPNAGGVLVLGLGCENSNIEVLKPYLGEYDKARVKFLVCQEVSDEIEEGIRLVNELALNMRNDKRIPCDISKLVVGLKCGGSDGLSGITANPVVGDFSDRIIAKGGSTILTEVPEMFGAETILMSRAASKEVFDKTVSLINDFKDYFISHGQAVYENPSPGNKAGGISTLEDKALGCTQKSGSSQVVDVLDYAGQLKKAGLNLLSAPGNDLVASTALALSGAQLILFTTGRGTPFACPVPTVKISTNTALYEKKRNWIDFDCGKLVDEGASIEELSGELYDFVLEVANGRSVLSESAGYCDLAIFKQGVTL